MTMTPGAVPISGTAANPRAGRNPSGWRRTLGLLVGFAAFMAVMVTDPPEGMTPEAWRVAGVALMMALWWVLEAIPIPATALAPIALLPLLGVAPVAKVTAPYANPLIFLFLGGFVLALAMERWNLHRRIALWLLGLSKANPAALVGGFMGATAFLSMWVSNTATATMMIPIGLSVAGLIGDEAGEEKAADNRRFTLALLLGIAYSASIGGVATLIGTPPNALLAGFMAETYGIEIGFGQWMMAGVPLAALLLAAAWWVLTKLVFPLDHMKIEGVAEMLEQEGRDLGPMSRGEKMVAAVFVATALAWMLRPLLAAVFPSLGLSDASIAVIAALVVFALPVEPSKRVFLLDWTATQRMPWGVLILVGGGLSLGAMIADTGLSQWIAGRMGGAADWPTVVLIAAVVALVMVISHLTSNTATAAAFLPLMASLSITLGENPLLLAAPMVLAASCVFMLPVATPPNAIVFASGAVTVPQMARAGLVVNLIAMVLIVAAAYSIMLPVLGIDLGVLPDWAR